MESLTEIKYFAQLIGCALCNSIPPELPESLKWQRIYGLSCYHHVENMTFESVQKLDRQPPEELKRAWQEKAAKSLVRELSFNIEREKILTECEKNKIAYLPLKGIILKEYYPKPGMRYSCDNDILYDESKQKELFDIMQSLGYEHINSSSQDDIFKKAPIYNFEMHRHLVNNKSESYDYCQGVWKRAMKDTDNGCGYHMTPEDTFIYMMIHFQKHFKGGGAGIRSLADIYVCLREWKGKLEWEYIQTRFRELKMQEWARDMEILAVALLDSNSSTSVEGLNNNLLEELDYIMGSGAYGLKKNLVHNRVKEQGKGKYLFSRIFVEREYMERRYPFVKKGACLIPIAWMCRIVRGLVLRWREIVKELQMVWHDKG